MMHSVGDVAALTQHLTMLHHDRVLLERLPKAWLQSVPDITWNAAGRRLLDVYCQVIADCNQRS